MEKHRIYGALKALSIG